MHYEMPPEPALVYETLSDIQVAAVCFDAARRIMHALGRPSIGPWENQPEGWRTMEAARVAEIRMGHILPIPAEESRLERVLRRLRYDIVASLSDDLPPPPTALLAGVMPGIQAAYKEPPSKAKRSDG